MTRTARRHHCFEITAELDATALEALRLELLRLAARHGLDVSAVSVERLTSRRPESPPPSRRRPSPAPSTRATGGGARRPRPRPSPGP